MRFLNECYGFSLVINLYELLMTIAIITTPQDPLRLCAGTKPR